MLNCFGSSHILTPVCQQCLCLKSRTFSLCLSLVSFRPNLKCLGSSHVSIPLSWPMSLSQKKCLDSTTAYVMESHIIQQNLRHCEHWLRHPYTDMIVFCTKFCISYVIQRHLLVTTCFIHCMLLNHCVMTVFSLKKRMNETCSTKLWRTLMRRPNVNIEIKCILIDVYILCLYQNIPLQYR